MKSASMVKIDPAKVKHFLLDNRLKQKDLAKEIGMTTAGMSMLLQRGTAHKSTLKLMCALYGVPESTFTPDPEPAETSAQAGYSLSLDVKPDKVRVAVLFDGRELYSAFYKVSGDTEVAMLRAISCASHICYELTQQKDLEG